MKRVIIAKSYQVWQWKMKRFPRPSEPNEIYETKLETKCPLTDALKNSVQFENDEILQPLTDNLPSQIRLITPGELNPTQFQLTTEYQIPYSIEIEGDCLVTDYPIVSNALKPIFSIEIGNCTTSKNGIRLFTSALIKHQFHEVPEAFTSGSFLQATKEMPVFYCLGKGGGVWLTSDKRGDYLQIPHDISIEKIAIELSVELMQCNLNLIDSNFAERIMYTWLERH